MDCINQSAGRANRNGANGKGIVKIYKLIDDNRKIYSSYVYSPALLDVTESILKGRDIIEEKDIYDINQSYFKGLKEVTINKELEEYNKYNGYIKG
ncbi:hypothetical protein H9X78_16090, partial [Clostridium saudiense]|nr:hypothetical protein [Clostridium saudiense]